MEKNKKILIVEDEPSMRRVIIDKLTNDGFTVVEAKDGIEGMEVGERERPDLILLDILMPRMDGIEMMDKARKTDWGKDIPIVILTNLVADDRITAGVVIDEPSFYLMKTDWPISEVSKKIHAALE
ncbi:MAG: response regulator [Candidatus Colwellbacteria bacterium]|nr:response regulator [Candidatus Colwellbacteria bacterium]